MAGALEVTWLGHSTVVLRLDGATVLTDPLLGRRTGPLLRQGPVPRPEQWEGTDGVLLSHLHHDHAELSSLDRVRGVPVLSAMENARWLRRRGVPGAQGLHDGTWHAIGGTRLRVRQVRADHAHRPMPHRPNAAHGHLLLGPSARIWVVGDTSLHDEMADLPALAGGPIDLAVVPVGGWGPRLSGGHLDPDAAARACAAAGVRMAVPVHWGTLYLPGTRSSGPSGWMDRPGPAFVDALAEHAPDCRPVVLAPGQSADLAADPPPTVDPA
jgi:L-ascorbate metabolism protein UlaG (beta-lactamase superfamily)